MTGPRTEARAGGAAPVGWIALVLASLLAPARPSQAGPAPRPYGSLALFAGSAQPDAGMADYQWDVRPHAAYGAQLLAGRGPWGAGVRVSAGGTTQALGLAGATGARVRLTRVELVGRAQLMRIRHVGLSATASFGRLGLAYRPDHVTVDAGGTPVEVSLAPIHTPVTGAGLGIEGPLVAGWAWGAGLERRWFSLDTAHRSGSEVIFARETFGDWDAHVALSHAWDW